MLTKVIVTVMNSRISLAIVHLLYNCSLVICRHMTMVGFKERFTRKKCRGLAVFTGLPSIYELWLEMRGSVVKKYDIWVIKGCLVNRMELRDDIWGAYKTE